MGYGKPYLPNIGQFIKNGIDPKTKLPIKLMSLDPAYTKDAIRNEIAKNDRQIAVNRYKWKNLPTSISSEELEKFLYLYGDLAFWYFPADKKFYFTKYALDGGLDFYGRYTKIHPIPLNGGGSDSKLQKAQEAMLSNIKLDVKYDVEIDDITKETLLNSAVILRDYTQGMGQQTIPAVNLNRPIMDFEAESMTYLRTSLLLGSGVKGLKVNNADEAAAVKDANAIIKQAALSGEAYTPIEGTADIDFQELTDGNITKVQDYLLATQAIDNFRLNTHGVQNGGFFEKKEYVNNAQTGMNVGGDVGLTLEDGLSQRRHFCNIVNSIWGLGISVDIAENLIDADIDGDGLAYDRNEYTGGQENDSNV